MVKVAAIQMQHVREKLPILPKLKQWFAKPHDNGAQYHFDP